MDQFEAFCLAAFLIWGVFILVAYLKTRSWGYAVFATCCLVVTTLVYVT